MLALILWGITKEPIIAIVFAIFSDGFACIPTIVKAWKFPETETGAPFITTLFSAFTSFFAIKIWDFASCAFPIYLVIACMVLIFTVYRKRLFIGRREINAQI